MTGTAETQGAYVYFLPVWIAVMLLFVAVDLFSTFTFEVLGDDGRLMPVCGLTADGKAAECDGVLSQGMLADFYLWHAAEFVPFLDVTGTLDWSAPVTYTGSAVGWLLLMFKGAIVVPIVLALRAVNGIRKQRAKPAKAADVA